MRKATLAKTTFQLPALPQKTVQGLQGKDVFKKSSEMKPDEAKNDIEDATKPQPYAKG